MCRKLLFILGVLFLLAVSAVSPVSVRAEGDLPPPPELVKPPWITGKNPNVSLSTGEEGELIPAGVIERWEGIEVPFLFGPSRYVEVAPLNEEETTPSFQTLAIPQRFQDPESVTCGAAALGMALEFLSLNGEGVAPSSKVLADDLKKSGLLYEMGTGVEELAYLAREHGYRGTTAFHNWTLEQLAEQLRLGKPVVVSLGVNGAGKPGHFVTMTGVSADGKWVSYNDPILGAQTVPVHDFLRSWSLQGNSGLVVQKQPLSTVNDPMLPWMGLFGALSTLAVLVRSDPGRSELKKTLSTIRGALSNPKRKGFGGRLSRGGGLCQKSRKLSSRSRKSKPKQRPKRRAKPKPKPKPRSTPRLESRRSVPSSAPRRPAQKMKPKPKSSLFGRIKKAISRVGSTVTKAVKSAVSMVSKTVPRVVSSVSSMIRRVVPSRSKSRTAGPRQSVLVATSGAGLQRAQVVAKSKPKRGGLFSRIGSAASNIASSVKKGVSILASSAAKTVNQRVNRIRTGASAVINQTRRSLESEVKWKLERNPKPTPTPIPIPIPMLKFTPIPTSTNIPIPSSTPQPEADYYYKIQEQLSAANDPKLDPGPNFWHNLGRWVSESEVSIANTVNQKIKEPVQNTVLNPSWWQEKVITASRTPQSVLSLSASEEWDINLFSQEGVIAQSYVPPNILKMLYVGQELNIKPKVKLTANPGSFIDVDITSGTYTLNLGENVSLFTSIKGGGMTLGVGTKKSSDFPEYDYEVEKHSLSATWRGLTHTYRKEGVSVQEELSTDELESKLITNLKCQTKTIKTEGILAVAGIAFLATLTYGAALPVLEPLAVGITSWLGALLNPALAPTH